MIQCNVLIQLSNQLLHDTRNEPIKRCYLNDSILSNRNLQQYTYILIKIAMLPKVQSVSFSGIYDHALFF